MKEEILPHYLAIGVSKAEFMKSCPVDLEPYDRAHNLRIKEQNFMLWLNGCYVSEAIMSIIGNSGWFKEEGTQPNEYPKEPYSFGERKTLTEDEKEREVDKFFAQESARRANWRRTHKK